MNRITHPGGRSGLARWLGPGFIMAASGIGASDIITATVGGATYGTDLMWALVVGLFFKYLLSEGIARWQLATGTTLLEGWSRYLPRWALALFMGYLVLWAIAVSGALVSGCGLAVENFSLGAISRSWGAVGHAVVAFGFIYTSPGGGFSRLMKPLIVVMFVSIVACAAMTFGDASDTLKGLVIPTIPSQGGMYVLSLIGGIGGSLTLLSYNYLQRDHIKGTPCSLRGLRADLALAYGFTAIFGLSVMLIATRVFHVAGVSVSDEDAVSRMAGQLAALIGPTGFYIYSIGFWATVLASLFGVWQTVPSIFADCYSLLRKEPKQSREVVMKVSSWQYRAALGFMALVSVPFALLDRPLLVVLSFTVFGSLFIPFLAATLLYLNNRVAWPTSIRRNNIAENIVLCLVLVLFLIVGGLEIWKLL